jgi:hypothetical protein
MIQILSQVNPQRSNEDCLEKDSRRPPVCIRKSPGNYCMVVFKNQNGTQQVKNPRSRPFLDSNTIKKREWYIHFLINYDNNWLPVNMVHANCLVRLHATKTNLNIFNVDKTIKCYSKVILCFLYLEIKKNIIFRKVSN